MSKKNCSVGGFVVGVVGVGVVSFIIIMPHIPGVLEVRSIGRRGLRLKPVYRTAPGPKLLLPSTWSLFSAELNPTRTFEWIAASNVLFLRVRLIKSFELLLLKCGIGRSNVFGERKTGGEGAASHEGQLRRAATNP